MKALASAAVLAASIALVGCGGGGGSAPTGTPGVDVRVRQDSQNVFTLTKVGHSVTVRIDENQETATVTSSTTQLARVGETFDLHENQREYFRGQINTYGQEVANIHADGWTGQDTTIVVFEPSHGDHGNTVTEIARGYNGAGGYAPNAELYYISVSDAVAGTRDAVIYDDTTSIAGDAQRVSINNVNITNFQVNNLSLGFESGTIYDFVSSTLAESTGVVNVVAQGNSGNTCATQATCVTTIDGVDYNSLAFAASQSNLNDHSVIAVGATNGANGDIANYSNRAGATQNYFIVADGNAYDSNGNVTGQGTSFAAPRVTGSVALLGSKYNNLTAQQARNIILFTADDLGRDGVDEVYGHGRLNVNRALSPLGNIR